MPFSDTRFFSLAQLMEAHGFDTGPEMAEALLDKLDPYRATSLEIVVAEHLDDDVVGVGPYGGVGLRRRTGRRGVRRG